MKYMNVLVFIQRQGVQLYYMDQQAPIACVLPPSTMRDLEIINEKELESFLAKALRPVSPKSQMQAILLLDDAVCFSSALEAGKEDEIKNAHKRCTVLTRCKYDRDAYYWLVVCNDQSRLV